MYRDYDLSKPEKEQVVNQYINNIIKDILQNEKKISDKWFVEYSVLATTIDPYRTNGSNGQLRCYSFIQDNGNLCEDGQSFKDKIEKYISPIIAVLKKTTKGEDDNWWFHNPETFLAPINIDPYISFTNNQDVDPDIVNKISERADIKEQELREGKTEGKYEQPNKNILFYSSSMEYSRTFSDMLSYCRSLYSTKMSTDANHINDILINHYHEGVENARLYYDKFVADKGEKFCYLTFPIVASPARFIIPDIYKNTLGDDFFENRYQGLGHCFIYFNVKEEPTIDEQLFEEKILALFQQINKALHNFAFNYTFNLGLQLQARAKKEAVKSAKAAIMSRNMSHNIGSHVMSYLKQHLGSVKDIVTDGILSDLINGENELAKKLENTTENTTLPFLMGLGHFISYLQERQDFIATIATDYIPYFGNVNFKDAIYDELNPDKRALRHSDRKNGSTDNILLGNIARSEGLGRSTSPTQHDSNKVPLNDIVLKFRTRFDGNPVVEIDDSGRITAVKDEVALGELDDMRKIDFSLPGGIVGRQAFFSIMENIIRNAAKHGNWRSMGNLELTFDVFSSKKEDVKRLENFNDDNVDEHSLTLKEVISNYYLEATDSKDLYFVTITDNCTMVTNRDGKQSWETIGKLRASLMSPYITDSGEMDGTNKGLKEIRISSAWLRAIHDESECFEPYGKGTKAALLINDKSEAWKKVNTEKKAPLIYVRISAEKGLLGLDASRLQYIICVQIPRKVALILKNDDKLQTIKTNLERINWRAYSKEDFLLERNKSFEFIIVDDLCDGYDNAFNDIRQYATARTFCLSDVKGLDRTDFLNRIKDENYTGSEDLELLYKTLSQYNENEMIVVDDKVVFERGKKNNPSKDVTIGEGKCMIQIHDGYKGTNSVYIYRRHHEANKEFTDFMESRMNALFVEGITGNNSTDRLVRNETLNSSWFYRHLHAMKQRIAIFDERLFHKITGLEEKDLKAKKLENCKDNTALAYIQKGVFPFTFVEDDNDEGCYLLKGIVFDQEAPVIEVEKVEEDAQSPINTYHCKCDTLAILRLIDGKLEPTSSSYGEYMENLFDFITIHQGLLDKLYEKFKIKDDIEGKKTITKTLFETYSRKKELSNGFIPGMIIHSGRSKPNKLEMPQMFPFIQYAALEHAVMDCKYSLVELLDFARYEE